MTPVAYFSRWKGFALSAACWVIAIVPLIPGSGHGLVYTAFFFTPVGTPVRIAACLFIGFLALVGLVMGIYAARAPLAVWIEGDELRWRALKVRSLPLASIASAELTPWRTVRVYRRDGGRSIEIPASIFRSPRDTNAVLTRLNPPG